jgi:hypothetical protein
MNEWKRSLAKGVYVAASCALAAGFAARCNHTRYTEIMDVDSNIGLIGGSLLFALLVAAIWLASRGKQSASWLTLGYGSWMTTYTMGYLGNLWTLPVSNWTWGVLVISVPFVWGGLGAASSGKWNAVLGWWLGSFTLLLALSMWSAIQ